MSKKKADKKTDNKSTQDFLPAGVDESSLPDDLKKQTKANEVPDWDSLGSDEESPSSSKGKKTVTSTNKWGATATEEMENFRHIPVVGLLPWRLQYIIISLIFIVSLGGLFYFSSASIALSEKDTQKTIFQNSISVINTELDSLLRGDNLNPEALSSAMSRASSSASVIGGDIASSWQDVEPLVQTSIDSETFATVIASTERLEQSLDNTVENIVPLWRAAGDAGEWASVDAVNFSQSFAEIRYLSEMVKSISSGNQMPERFSTSRQNIEQSLRMYASSPSSSIDSNLSRAYNNLAAGFSSSIQDLDVLQGNRQKWNAALGGIEIFKSFYQSTIVSPSLLPTQPPSTRALWVCGAIVIISLLLLVGISLKQHRWRILQAHALNEQMHYGIEDLGQQLEGVSFGDLTTQVSPSSEIFLPLASHLNNTIDSIKKLVVDIKSTTDVTNNASDKATHSTGLLVDDSRNQAESMMNNGKDIISIITAVESVLSLSSDAYEMAHESVDSVSVGQRAVEKVQSSMKMINEKTEEGAKRSHRLHKSSFEISNIVALINEIAEQMSVLSIQAALQAAKAGDAGKGFRVVADGLKSLSEKSGEGARSVGALIEANISDIVSLEETMEMMNRETSEGVALIDTSIEASLMAEQRLSHLKDYVEKIKQEVETQEQTANSLSSRTEQGLSDIGSSTVKAQDAAESVMELVEAVRDLNESIIKFKVQQ